MTVGEILATIIVSTMCAVVLGLTVVYVYKQIKDN